MKINSVNANTNNYALNSVKSNVFSLNFRQKVKNIAVYPGTFDPITNGHLDLIKAVAKFFDELIVLIAKNPNKTPRFSVKERKKLIEESVKDLPNVKVDYYEGLTVNYAKEHGANTLLRGMRPRVQDFEDEVRMHDANEKRAPGILTIYVLASSINKAVSSSAVRELIDTKDFGKIKEIVPEPVYNFIVEKFGAKVQRGKGVKE